jgi:hypothetical protein
LKNVIFGDNVKRGFVPGTLFMSMTLIRRRFNRRDRERNHDDLKRVDYRAAVMNAYAMLPLSSNQLMVLHEQPEAMPA